MTAKGWGLIAVLILWPAPLKGQETHLVSGTAPLSWPRTADSAVRANKLPESRIELFLNSLRSGVRGDGPTKVSKFVFVPLEKDRFYLVASCGGRIESDIDVVAPHGQGYQYTEIESNAPFPLSMQTLDLDGDGVDELVTAEWPAGYQGASTPPIYWYTVWRFKDGTPLNVSARFPEFYRNFVLGQSLYLGELLSRLQSVDPESVRVPLDEIEYVRLKFQRAILGKKNAGLEQALAWAESGDVNLRMMGMSSLAEMPAEAANNELVKLSHAPVIADLAKAFLARRTRLLGNTRPQETPK